MLRSLLPLLLLTMAVPARAQDESSGQLAAASPPALVTRYGADPQQIGELRLPRGKGPFPVAVVISFFEVLEASPKTGNETAAALWREIAEQKATASVERQETFMILKIFRGGWLLHLLCHQTIQQPNLECQEYQPGTSSHP